MNTNSPLQSRSLTLFLFRPLEVAALVTALLFVLKFTAGAAGSLITWWILALMVVVVPVLFAILFGIIYILTWIFTLPEEK